MSDLIGAANNIAEELEGTCKSLQEVLGDDYQRRINDTDFCNALDELVLCCSICGWWSVNEETTDESGEVVCLDCCNDA